MRLIVAVGNPGTRYARTRFNAGFIVVDKIAQQLGNIYPRQERFEWKITGKYLFIIIKENPLTMLVKPRTYINQIGSVVKTLAQFYLKGEDGLSFKNLFICCYDQTIPLGEYKVDEETSNHEILEKISSSLGDDKFWKIRIGVKGKGLGKGKGSQELLEIELDDVEFATLRYVADLIIKDLDLVVGEAA